MGFPSKHTTAILVFAHSAGEEVKYKPITKGVQLFDALTEHTLSVVAKTQLPYFHFSEDQQTGYSFGERFTNALQSVFDKGFEQVITIGNDTPLLQTAHILEAKKQLDANKFVLGPSADGGFYLMGIHQSKFEPNQFKQLPWQTSSLFDQLVSLVSQENEVFKLQTLHDIDSEKDVKSIISYAYHIVKKLRKVLSDVFGHQKIRNVISLIEYTSVALRIRHNRGSPIILS